MGRQARLKHEQRLARAQQAARAALGLIDDWRGQTAPSDIGKGMDVRRARSTFIDGINAKGGPVYTGWVPVTSSDSVTTPSDDDARLGDIYTHTAKHRHPTSGTDDAARRYDAARRADEASRRERERMNQEPVTIEARMPEAWEDWAMRSRVQFVGGASRPDCTKARRDPRKAQAQRKAQGQARRQARKRR